MYFRDRCFRKLYHFRHKQFDFHVLLLEPLERFHLGSGLNCHRKTSGRVELALRKVDAELFRATGAKVLFPGDRDLRAQQAKFSSVAVSAAYVCDRSRPAPRDARRVHQFALPSGAQSGYAALQCR
jgi:hypothetical protein